MKKTLGSAPVDVLQHPQKDEARIFFYEARTNVLRGAENPEDKPIVEYVGSDDSEDRYGSIIDPRGWETDAYMRSGAGVLLWAHQYDTPPVGRTVKLTKSAKALIFRCEFAVKQSEFAREIYELVRDGFLPGVSVGFIPKAAEEYEAETVNSYFAENKRYTRVELLELSVVPVPANRNAIKKAYADGKLSDRTVELAHLRGFLQDGPLYLSRTTIAQRDEVDTTIPEPKDETGKESQPEEPKLGTNEVIDKTKDEPKDEAKEKAATALAQMRDWVYVDEQEELEIDDAERAAEMLVMNALAKSYVEQVEVGINGWMDSKHSALRSLCRGAVMNGMWSYDDIRSYMKSWYGQTPNAKLIEDGMENMPKRGTEKLRVTINAESFKKEIQDAIALVFIDPTDPIAAGKQLARDTKAVIDASERKGAKLSKKNKETLLKALELLQSLDGLTGADEDEDEDGADKTPDATETDTANAETNDVPATPATGDNGDAAQGTDLVGGTSGTKNGEAEKERSGSIKPDDLAEFRRALKNLGSVNGGGVTTEPAVTNTATGEQQLGSVHVSPPKRSYLDVLVGRKSTK